MTVGVTGGCTAQVPLNNWLSFCFDAVVGWWWPGCSGGALCIGTAGCLSGSTAWDVATQGTRARQLHRHSTARSPLTGVTPFWFKAVAERWQEGCFGCFSQPVLLLVCPVVPLVRVPRHTRESQLYRDKERLYRYSAVFAVTVGF